MLQPYRVILTRPGAAAFSAAGALARLPMAMTGIALVLMVSEVYGSYGLAGRVSAVYVLTHAFCAPQLSRLVDRHGQARVMRPAFAVTAIGLTGLLVTTALEGPTPALYASAVVAGSTMGSVGAMVRARWSHLLHDPRQLHTAYSLESALDELLFVLGPVLATVLATGVTPTAALVLPLLALGAGGMLFLGQRSTEPPPSPPAPGSRSRSAIRHRGMGVLAVTFVGMGAVLGATDVATVAFAREQGSPAAAGPVLAVFALGSLLAGLGYGARHWRSPLWVRFTVGMLALAGGASLFLLVTSLPVLAAVMFVTGLAIAPTLITGNALVRHLVPHAQLTEGLAWVGTALGVGVSFGASIAGSWVDGQGSTGGFVVVMGSAGICVVVTLAALPMLRRAVGDDPGVAEVGPGPEAHT
ncbi:MFS transporter [Cellulomonas bogoriensis]|uniref:Major facilitator transporter n=1 Tax=Cellulomonas bogoriensis 69B4 = DSM 16987 TaxID=1386082 RepID=A0A0A0BTC0_9CELL|nr:MFS transporter [Cellulomonas bogoriensis]KGM11171.1 major facilitator transporter [Cellulomonas bogoriensis 69B4 = DSM 16987]